MKHEPFGWKEKHVDNERNSDQSILAPRLIGLPCQEEHMHDHHWLHFACVAFARSPLYVIEFCGQYSVQ
jgi:hypothetical protein